MRDPKGLIKTYIRGAIFDEIQRVPSLLSYLQTEVDRQKTPGRFILTGSNQYMLQEKLNPILGWKGCLVEAIAIFLYRNSKFSKKRTGL